MTAIESRKPIVPLPYSYYFFTVVIILLIGLFDSIYLAISHYKLYTDIGYQSFCAISQAFNCDTVSQSSYSIFLGVPVSVWGVFGYLFTVVLLIFRGLSKHKKNESGHYCSSFPLASLYTAFSWRWFPLIK